MKISVIIATRNRCNDLRKTINEFLKQTYQNKEIIVIDNASDDGTKEMMTLEYSDIKYLRLPDNIDILAQNLGIELSSGDIIWRTDDDSYPESYDTFSKVIDIFNTYKNIDIIATEDIEVLSGNLVWNWHPLEVDKNNVPPQGYVTNKFHGTGAAIKKTVFDKIGGFWEFGHEELEFSARAIKSGFSIRYFPNIRTLHFAVPTGRNKSIRWIKLSNQLVRYKFKHFPLHYALGRAFWYLLFEFSTAFFRGISFSAYVENLFRIPATAIHTFRDEHEKTTKEQMKQITLGISAFHDVKNHFLHMFKSLIHKIKK